MGSTLSWHWPLNSTNSAASNFQPLESMPEIPSNNNSNSISGSTKPLLGETLSMPLLPNYHFSVENNTVVMENTRGGNENTPLQGNLLRGIVNCSDATQSLHSVHSNSFFPQKIVDVCKLDH
jgi:hypothetical protein